MPNHSKLEEICICNLTKCYLLSNLDQKEAYCNCLFHSLHLYQASYGQKNFVNIGIIYKFVSYFLFHTCYLTDWV